MKISFKKLSILLLAVAFILGAIPHLTHALTLSPVRFEVSGDPGKVISEDITLINEGDSDETYYSSFSNFEASGETGTPIYVDPADGLGTWMQTPAQIMVPAHMTRIVPLTIAVPSTAEPGGYFAAVFWGNNPIAPGQVAIGTKLGTLVLLTVNGDVKEAGGILDFTTMDAKNFYTSLPVPFTYRFRNDGGDRVKPEGSVIIKNIFGFISARVPANQVEGNVLPNQTRKFEAAWQSKNADQHTLTQQELDNAGFWQKARNEWYHFAFGFYGATLSLSYGTNMAAVSPTVKFWVIPWHLLIVILLALIIVIGLLRAFIHRYNRWIIKQVEFRIKSEQQAERKQ